MRLKKRLLAFSRRLHARIRKTRYMHKMRCLLINRRSLLLALISKHLIRSEERFSRNAETEIYTLSLHDALPISATSRQNTKDQVYAQNEMLAYQQKESTARVDKQASH